MGNPSFPLLQHGRTALHYAVCMHGAEMLEDLLTQSGINDAEKDDVNSFDFIFYAKFYYPYRRIM